MKIVIDISEKDLKFMRSTYKEGGVSFVPRAIKNECVKAVYNGTPYDERKTGKWEFDELGFLRCSNCRTHYPNMKTLRSYCSHCGAKMEVDNAGSD